MSSPLDQQLGEIKNQGEIDQYLTFILAGEEYGVNILKVVEIRGMTRACK